MNSAPQVTPIVIATRSSQFRMYQMVTIAVSLTLLAGSILSCGGGGSAEPGLPASPAQAVVIDKWHPGIYVKVEDWQWYKQGQVNQINDTEMAKIYNELATTPGLRGIKIVLKWGRYEGSPGVYDFSRIDEILAKLADDPALKGKDKHLIVSFPWREFQSVKGASEILPNDLQGGTLWNDPDLAAPDWSHIDYDRLWAYKVSNVTGSYAYDIKLWDPAIIARLDAFFAALAQRYDKHPNVTMVSTTESAIGEPVIPFVAGESAALQFAGQIEVIRRLKKYFIHSLVMSELNYDRPHVANMVNNVLQQEKVGLGSPNNNMDHGLNCSATTNPSCSTPGVLTYYPGLSGRVVLAPEIQGDDFESVTGTECDPVHPTYDYLYDRVRFDLKANYTVIQRNTPYWLGGTVSTPSCPSRPTVTAPAGGMLQFLKDHDPIKNDPTGAGGLDHNKPLSVP
ncbi:hypothetical protein [Nitrospira lenta]|nr:hypothetical protein [Nitrospira lenta]